MPEVKAPAANVSHFKLAEHHRAIYYLIAPLGVTYEDILRPEFWAHVASRINGPMDHIEVLAEDYTFHVVLMVMDKGTNWVKVVPISDVRDLSQAAPDEVTDGEESPYEVKFGGPKDRYRVLRKSDNSVIKSGFANKTEAEKYVSEYRRAVAI